MTLLQSIILGIIQGLTEFLPISSSAHLVLVPYLFGWEIPADQVFVFDVLVQMGTLLAVIVYFWKDLVSILVAVFQGLVQRHPFATQEARLGWYLVLATIPAGLAGLALKDLVEQAFNSPTATAFFLLVTSALLILAEIIGKRSRNISSMNWKDALWIGVSQIISIFPGISRSGSTITGGMLRNFERSAAARFSFLMSIPIMLAAGGSAAVDLLKVPSLGQFLPLVLVGMLAALVVGYLSIHWLLRFLTHRPLIVFAIYCAVLSIIILIFSYVA